MFFWDKRNLSSVYLEEWWSVAISRLIEALFWEIFYYWIEIFTYSDFRFVLNETCFQLLVELRLENSPDGKLKKKMEKKKLILH